MNNISIFGLICCFLLSFLTKLSTQNPIEKQSFTILKFPLSSLVGDSRIVSTGFGVGLEKLIKNRWSIGQDVALIYHSDIREYLLRSNVDNVKGFRTTTEIRRYWGKEIIPKNGLFTGFDIDYLHTKSEKEGSRLVRNRVATHLNVGLLNVASSKTKHTSTVEFVFGFGLRYLHQSGTGYLLNAYPPGLGLSLNVDIKLGITLNQKYK